jgi:hypothetical protein
MRPKYWLTIVALAVAGGSSFGGRNKLQDHPSSVEIRHNPVDHLSSSKKIRFAEIMRTVIQNEEMPTQAMHEEFWVLLDTIGKLSPEDVEYVRDVLTGITTTYMKYLYEDAWWALKTEQPFKSMQREEYETRLIGLGAMTATEGKRRICSENCFTPTDTVPGRRSNPG